MSAGNENRTEGLIAMSKLYTREAWLRTAIDAFRPRFEAIEMPLPDEVHVSVGFGFGAKAESATILGQCWARRASEDNINHVFISPEVDDTARILDILMHECVHAANDCADGHKGPFAVAAKALGLTGKMTATVAGSDLAAELTLLSRALGPYPHGALTYASRVRRGGPAPAPVPGDPSGGRISSGPGAQKNRQLKVTCAKDGCGCGGYVARTTARWLEVGNPLCPMGAEMQRV